MGLGRHAGLEEAVLVFDTDLDLVDELDALVGKELFDDCSTGVCLRKEMLK